MLPDGRSNSNPPAGKAVIPADTAVPLNRAVIPVSREIPEIIKMPEAGPVTLDSILMISLALAAVIKLQAPSRMQNRETARVSNKSSMRSIAVVTKEPWICYSMFQAMNEMPDGII